jgi:cell division protein FtsW (lipid II flippase)
MKRDPTIIVSIFLICVLGLVAIFLFSSAAVNDTGAFNRWDTSDIIVIFTTFLAAVLAIISFIGYRRDRRTKVLLVTLAFLIFTLKGVFIVSGDFFGRRVHPLFDMVANLLDFGVLACLFFGMTMK